MKPAIAILALLVGVSGCSSPPKDLREAGPAHFLEDPKELEHLSAFLQGDATSSFQRCLGTDEPLVVDADGTTIRYLDTIRAMLLACAWKAQSENATQAQSLSGTAAESKLDSLQRSAHDSLESASDAINETWRNSRTLVDLEVDAYLMYFWTNTWRVDLERVPVFIASYNDSKDPADLARAMENLAHVVWAAKGIERMAMRERLTGDCLPDEAHWNELKLLVNGWQANATSAVEGDSDEDHQLLSQNALDFLGPGLAKMAEYGWYPGLGFSGSFLHWVEGTIVADIPPLGTQEQLLNMFSVHRDVIGISLVTQYHMDAAIDQVRLSRIQTEGYWDDGTTLEFLVNPLIGVC